MLTYRKQKQYEKNGNLPCIMHENVWASPFLFLILKKHSQMIREKKNHQYRVKMLF